MKTINGVTIVSNDVEVTGLTGDDTLVDFSSEVVYLTEAPTISGMYLIKRSVATCHGRKKKLPKLLHFR